MQFYVVTFYNKVNNNFYEQRHRNHKYLNDAKDYVQEHLEASQRLLQGFEYKENKTKSGTQDNGQLYEYLLSHDGYYSQKIEEKITIREEYMY